MERGHIHWPKCVCLLISNDIPIHSKLTRLEFEFTLNYPLSTEYSERHQPANQLTPTMSANNSDSLKSVRPVTLTLTNGKFHRQLLWDIISHIILPPPPLKPGYPTDYCNLGLSCDLC